MSDDPSHVTMREKVRVVKIDKDHPDAAPVIVEQETESSITLDEAALLGFVPGQGFTNADGPAPPSEGIRVGD